MRERRALGELDHPESSVVNLNNASHNILEMHWDNDDLLGTVEVLSTPAGNILKELFRSGIKLGISSRGLGSVEPVNEAEGEDGTVEVLSTPAGNILKELFRSGIKLGISSRGLGSVEPVNEADGEEGTVEVQPDFELIAFDFVSNQSTHGAFMRPVNESVGHSSPESNLEKIVNDIMRG